jgi:hypothetical protein
MIAAIVFVNVALVQKFGEAPLDGHASRVQSKARRRSEDFIGSFGVRLERNAAPAAKHRVSCEEVRSRSRCVRNRHKGTE